MPMEVRTAWRMQSHQAQNDDSLPRAGATFANMA